MSFTYSEATNRARNSTTGLQAEEEVQRADEEARDEGSRT